MKIAIIGWGSLIWDPRNLPHYGPWLEGGPSLKIEFSRISTDCRLTLVIDPDHGAACPTRYALSPRSALDDAVEDLRVREGSIQKRIGYFDRRKGLNSHSKHQEQVDLSATMTPWCENRQMDGVVWTALLPNFEHETGKPFTVENAMTFLKGLPTATRENALKYIRRASEEIVTPVRTRIGQVWPEA